MLLKGPKSISKRMGARIKEMLINTKINNMQNVNMSNKKREEIYVVKVGKKK